MYTDTSGRFIICHVKIEEKCITLAILYAPNDDKPTFNQNVLDHVIDFQCKDVIIEGHLNLLLDLDKVKMSGRAKTHTEVVVYASSSSRSRSDWLLRFIQDGGGVHLSV